MTCKTGLLGLMMLWLAGCSTHYYEGEPPRTTSEVKAILAEVTGAQASNVGTAMQSQTSAVVYYGESAAKGINNLLSFFDFAWLTGNSDPGTINGGRVFLLDNMSVDGTVGLVIGMDVGNGYTYYGFTGAGDVKDNVFRAELTGASGNVLIESIDNDGSILDDIIQLRVYVKDATGKELYAGKISTLFAYQ